MGEKVMPGQMSHIFYLEDKIRNHSCLTDPAVRELREAAKVNLNIQDRMAIGGICKCPNCVRLRTAISKLEDK